MRSFFKKNLSFSISFKLLFASATVLFCSVYYSLFLGQKIFTNDAIIWYGHFHYFADTIQHGRFPYWDPYVAGGSYFYPNISAYGLLDPLVWFGIFLSKLCSVPLFMLYIYFRLARLLLFTVGGFLLFKRLSGSKISASIGTVVLLFGTVSGYFGQNGSVDIIYLTPFALHFLLGFFKADADSAKLLNAALLVAVSGIMLNIFIPVCYALNLLVFTIVLLCVKRAYVAETLTFLKSRRNAGLMLLMIALVVLMAAPPLMVATRDASGHGELFPMLRIVQSNNGFKAITASDISDDSLSDRFTREAISISWGDMVRILYPDLSRSRNLPVNTTSESFLYIGILPLFFCIVGAAYAGAPFNYLLVASGAIIFVNGFNFSGVHADHFSMAQRFFNLIFPPLKTVHVRESFGSFLLLYLCALASLGFAQLFRPGRFNDLITQKRSQLIAICVGLALMKCAISYAIDGVIISSAHDGFILFQLILCAGGIHYASRAPQTRVMVLQVVITVCTLADVSIYSAIYRDREWSLQDGTQFSEALGRVEEQRMDAKEFEYFRNPYVFLPINYPLASQESIAKEKGAFTYGNNHMFFTTRRYYDLFTHASLENQFILFGMVYPLVRFYPSAQVVQVDDKHALLDYFSGQSDAGARLFLEDPNKSYRTSPFSGDFKQYPDAGWLAPKNVMNTYNRFVSENLEVLTQIRSNPAQFLSTPEGSVRVTDFSANEVVMEVENAVDGYLYYNDGWSRYWRAFDNGREIPVQIANYNFKAVFIAPGRHRVRFLFDPLPYRIGLAAYWTGLFVSVGLIVYFRRRQKGELPR